MVNIYQLRIVVTFLHWKDGAMADETRVNKILAEGSSSNCENMPCFARNSWRIKLSRLYCRETERKKKQQKKFPVIQFGEDKASARKAQI
jgi:hypothetical protein